MAYQPLQGIDSLHEHWPSEMAAPGTNDPHSNMGD